MLETIREFGVEQLALSGEESQARNRLAAWFLEQAGETVAAFETCAAVEAVERLEADYANLTASLEWLEGTDQGEALLRLAGALGDFWYFTGRLNEGRDWLERALAAAPEVNIAARVWSLYAAGHLAHRFGEYEVAVTRLLDSVALARQLDLPRHEAGALLLLGVVDEDRGNYNAAEPRLLAGRELFQQHGGGVGPIVATFHLSVVAYGRGEIDRARQLWEEALTTAKANNVAIVATWCLEYLGLLGAESGNLSVAAKAIRDSMALGRSIAHRHHRGRLLSILAVLGGASKMYEMAARLHGAAAGLEGHGDRAELPERLAFESTEARGRAALGEETYTRAWREGAAFRPADLTAAVETVLNAAAARDDQGELGFPVAETPDDQPG